MASEPLPPAPERPEALPAVTPPAVSPSRPPASPVAAPAPVKRPTPDPTRRLASGARALWTLEAVAGALPVLLVAGVASGPIAGAAWAPDLLLPSLWGLLAVGLVVRVAVVPQLRWRRWRYEVRESEIDLRRGAFTVRRTLVPMSRVQHVDTRRTVLSEFFGLAAVVFHTAAGANEIPALAEAEAAAIRDAIADLASMSDDPV